MDLVSPDEAAEVERKIRAINPYAEIRRATKSDVPIDAVLGRDATTDGLSLRVLAVDRQ
jgi:G3E family GTPase